MTRTQKLIKSILPKTWADSMEKESREWMMRCASCGFEKSVWDFGGIRWKASGTPQRKVFCENCKILSTHTTYRKTMDR